MIVTRKELDELDAKIDLLERYVDKIREDMYEKGWLESRVAYALERVLETHQGMTIKHYLGKKEITTKIVRDEVAELEQQQYELEDALERVKKITDKYKHKKAKK